MAQQLVKMKFKLVRELKSLGRTAWFGDIADVPYEEALDCLRCGVAYPCNEYGGEEGFPDRAEATSMEDATSLIQHDAESVTEEAIDPVHDAEEKATKPKKSQR